MKPKDHKDILAGAYTNLLNRQRATIAQYRCGKGRLVISTVNLVEQIHDDPVAVPILTDLIEYVTGDVDSTTEFLID